MREAEMVAFAVLASPGLGWETDEIAGWRRPVLRQTWSIDPATGKPVARWVSEGPPRAGVVAPAGESRLATHLGTEDAETVLERLAT
jgi:hypothetical protein